MINNLLQHAGKNSSEDFRGPSVNTGKVDFIKLIKSYPLGQNGRHFADAIYRCILVNGYCILIKISLKFVPKGLIGNNSALVSIMSWVRTCDKIIYEAMLTLSNDAHMQGSKGRWVKLKKNPIYFIILYSLNSSDNMKLFLLHSLVN